MRRSDREITDFEEISDVLDGCQTIRLGLHDEKYPYVVPLSFGWEAVDNRVYIYFHCAKEGKKVDLIAKNNAVCVECDILNRYVKTEKSVTADYLSVICFGRAEKVRGEEAEHGLKLLLEHCGQVGSPRDCLLSGMVAVYKITVDEITGKKRFK